MKYKNLNFYTDGAYSSTKQRGGWAVYCPELDVQLAATEKNTTNNRMEMISALTALEWVLASNVLTDSITIYSDSLYVINTMRGLYNKKSNLDIWERLDYYSFYIKAKGIIIEWRHVKGHNGDVNNEIVDKFANHISQKSIT
jgi:ribonuclease HI